MRKLIPSIATALIACTTGDRVFTECVASHDETYTTITAYSPDLAVPEQRTRTVCDRIERFVMLDGVVYTIHPDGDGLRLKRRGDR